MVTIPERATRYFTLVLLLFISGFVILPTAKMVNNVYYALMFLPTCLVVFTRWGHSPVRTLEIGFWSALLAWSAVVGLQANEPAHHIKDVLYVGCFVYAISHYVSAGLFRTAAFARIQYWVISLYIIGATLFYWSNGKYAIGEKILWLPSRLDGPNFTSMCVAASFALALATWVRERRHIELTAGIAGALFITIYALQSRSGVVGLAFAGIIYCIHLATRSGRYAKIVGAGLAGTAVVTVGAAASIPKVGALFARKDAYRFEIWQAIIADWNKCGLWRGCGLDFHSNVILSSGGPIFHPHNMFLAWGVYSGLIALLLFCGLMCLTLRRAWLNRDAWGLYLATALFCLNFDGSKLIGNPDELWLLVLLPAALIINQNSSKTPELNLAGGTC